MKRLKISAKQAAIGGGIVIVLLLMADFNNRMSELNRMKAQQERAAAEVTYLIQTQQVLETQIAYATSQAAVEEWAYEEGRFAREGDRPVVPIPAEGSLPTPTPEPVSAIETVHNWDVWLALFFDREP